MKKFLLPLAGIALLTACSTAPKQKLVLHYDRPAQFFEEALPL